MSDSPQAAWFVDPTGRHQHRWWDGAQWTDQIADGQAVGTDPVLAATGATQATSIDSGTIPQSPVPVTGSPHGALTGPVSVGEKARSWAGSNRNVVVIVAVIAVAVVVGLVMALGGGGEDGGWPSAVKDQIVSDCTERGTSQSECACVVDSVEASGYPLDQFLEDSVAYNNQTGAIPSEILQAALECEVNS